MSLSGIPGSVSALDVEGSRLFEIRACHKQSPACQNLFHIGAFKQGSQALYTTAAELERSGSSSW